MSLGRYGKMIVGGTVGWRSCCSGGVLSVSKRLKKKNPGSESGAKWERAGTKERGARKKMATCGMVAVRPRDGAEIGKSLVTD